MCCKVLCYLKIKWEQFIITYNSSKHKQNYCLVVLTEWIIAVNLSSFFITSGISSNRVVYTYYGQATTEWFKQDKAAQK